MHFQHWMNSHSSDTLLPSTMFTSLVYEQGVIEEMQEQADETVGDIYLGKRKTRLDPSERNKRVKFVDQIKEDEDVQCDDSTIGPSTCHDVDSGSHSG